MVSLSAIPSASSVFSAYASVSATVMLVRSLFYDVVPQPLRQQLSAAVLSLLRRPSSLFNLLIYEYDGIGRNELYDVSHTYLCTKITATTSSLSVAKTPKQNALTLRFNDGESVSDSFQGIALEWSLATVADDASSSSSRKIHDPSGGSNPDKRFFQLSFDRSQRETVLSSYLPHVLARAKAIKEEEKAIKIYTLQSMYGYGSGTSWEPINLDHPATFEKLAMDPKAKQAVIEDLDRFVRRKELYKRVGRAWKRGYLLYGPPGTGKSSLIAAIANYLKFDIYDLQLASIFGDSDLRKLLLCTTNKSILVIEDIDCSIDLPDRRNNAGGSSGGGGEGRKRTDFLQLTLSGLLNFIDGLWSSCGDERIVIFTTNDPEKLDPALLRPGRMDLHLHMSYCTPDGFRLLASNYLGVSSDDDGNNHREAFGEIEELMSTVQATPAQVAEELMKSDDADEALGEVVKLLKRKKKDEAKDGDAEGKEAATKAKRRRIAGIGNRRKAAVRNYLLKRTMALRKSDGIFQV